MPSKETLWKRKRCGYITASMLADITSKSGKIIDTNLAAIRAKRFERKRGYSLPVSSRPMEIGSANEPYIIAWFRENHPELPIVYAQELPEIPFWEVSWAKFGASPDAFTEDEKIVVECKTVVSNSNIEFFADENTPYGEKKLKVWDEHGDQILGQFLSNQKVEEIWLVKHIFCDEFNEEDTDSPLAPWRGMVFKFSRKDYESSIAEMKDRICLFDAFIDAPINPTDFKKGEWYLDSNGKLNKK